MTNKLDFQTVSEYIASQPDAAAAQLELVRSTIRRALPMAEEVISYKMPAYKLDGKVILYFAGWKEHYSLYPAGARLAAAFKNELASCTLHKGTIRFPLAAPVPTKLIAAIAQFRLAEVSDRSRSSSDLKGKAKRVRAIQ